MQTYIFPEENICQDRLHWIQIISSGNSIYAAELPNQINLIELLCWVFTAQSTEWGHVERGQFT